jgi:hypothetical protein
MHLPTNLPCMVNFRNSNSKRGDERGEIIFVVHGDLDVLLRSGLVVYWFGGMDTTGNLCLPA